MEATSAQIVFVRVCRIAGLPMEQTLISLSLFSDEDLLKILRWAEKLTNERKRFVTKAELAAKIFDMATE